MQHESETNSTNLLAQRLLRYMPGVRQQHQDLQLVEAAWDSLALLSSLSRLTAQTSSGTDLSRARKDFSALSTDMVRGLARQAIANVQTDLDSKAQVAIDILVRNLFERTADIGFLAQDEVLTRYAAECSNEQEDASALCHPERNAVEQRLASYVSFYSVYRSVHVYDKSLRRVAHHRARPATGQTGAFGLHAHSTDGADPIQSLTNADSAWLRQVLESPAPYTESYGLKPSFDPEQPTLVYARALKSGGQVCGVLCLEFQLDDELPAIFEVLLPPEKDTPVVLALADGERRIIGSSDPLQLPTGWQVPNNPSASPQVLRHLGREYLMSFRPAQAFEGYAGPGWMGLAVVPLELAFESSSSEVTSALMEEVASHPDFLTGELREIPARSTAIRTALERSVWNGLIDVQRMEGQPGVSASDVLFAQTLLSEIGVTAQKTARAFSGALQDLHRSVVRAQSEESLHRATVLLQILDRNLYERANDCRWWALTPTLIRALQSPSPAQADQATKVLSAINDLYTVYTGIVLFDSSRTVVAVSKPGLQDLVGTVLDAGWAHQCLQLPPHAYCVSPWQESALNGTEPTHPTFIYSAALHAEGHSRPMGGIALVWNGVSQMNAMLRDCSLGCSPEDTLAFIDAQGHTVLTVGEHHSEEAVRQAVIHHENGMDSDGICEIDGHLQVLGLTNGSGYREYRHGSQSYQHQLRAMMLTNLCERDKGVHDLRQRRTKRKTRTTEKEPLTKLATFWVGPHWMSVPASWIRFAAPEAVVLGAGQARPPVIGMSELGGRVFPVIDLSLVASDGPGRSPMAGNRGHQMVVLSLAADGELPVELVIRVEALGGIQDVFPSELKSLRQGTSGPAALVQHVVGIELETELGQESGSSSNALLMVLSKDWLLNLYRGLPVDMRGPLS